MTVPRRSGRGAPARLGLAVVLALLAGTAPAAQTALTPAERDARCLESAHTGKEIDECFHRSSAIEARKIADLRRELEATLEAPRAVALVSNLEAWKRQAVAECQWESGFYDDPVVARGVLTRCVAALTARRIERLKIFLCEDAGLNGPCEASEKY